MSSRNASLTFDCSVELLCAIFPDENWPWLLSKNLHGIMEGFDVIPFDRNASEIIYQFDDLQLFAVKFGNGNIDAEEIALICDDYMFENDQDLDAELDELLGDLGDPWKARDKFVQAHLDADRNVRFGLDELTGMFRAIDDLADEQQVTGYVLTTLAHVIRALGSGSGLSGTEVAALSGVATSQAKRACDNADQMRSLFN